MDTKASKDVHRRVFGPIAPETERVCKAILDAAFKVHSDLGPGLLESVHEACCAYVLRKNGESVETQVALPVAYHSIQWMLGCGWTWF